MLTNTGIDVVAEHPGFDDSVLEVGGVSGHPERWVAALAYLKARSGADLAREHGAVWALGADTACVLRPDGAAPITIGTPRDADEARAILRAMLPQIGAPARVHDVLTGVALVDVVSGQRIVIVDVARVRMGAIDDATLDSYIASGQWVGKAGAYNLADRRASGWPLDVEGDPTTVMGLPMRRLIRLFQRLAIMPHAEVTP